LGRTLAEFFLLAKSAIRLAAIKPFDIGELKTPILGRYIAGTYQPINGRMFLWMQ